MSDMTEAPNVRTVQASLAADSNYDLLAGVSLRISVEVGSASLTLSKLLNLGEGSVVELDRQANDVLDIIANGTLIATGEVVEVNGRYGVRVVDVIAADRRSGEKDRRS